MEDRFERQALTQEVSRADLDGLCVDAKPSKQQK